MPSSSKIKQPQKRRLFEPENEDVTFFSTRTVNTRPSTQRYVPKDLNRKINCCERAQIPQYNNDNLIASAILWLRGFGTS